MTSGSDAWLVRPGFDVPLVFGGAALSIVVVLLTIGAGLPIVPIWWVWLLAFDGPHMMATYSRTYLDARAWRQRRALLLGSLAVFAIGPLALAATVASSSDAPFLGFLAVATTYGYWHVVRQHYGFFALYGARSREQGKRGIVVDRWALYAGCWAPYIHFLVVHPRSRQLIGLAGDAPAAVGAALVAVWLASLVVIVARERSPSGAASAARRSSPTHASSSCCTVWLTSSWVGSSPSIRRRRVPTRTSSCSA